MCPNRAHSRADPHAPEGVLPGLVLPDQKQEADRKDRHLHHAGQVTDIRDGADIAMLPGVQEMEQAEAAHRQQEAEKGLLPPGGKKHRRRQNHQQNQPDDSGGCDGLIPCPVGQHVQAGLCRKQQHQPESGPPDSISRLRQRSHLLSQEWKWRLLFEDAI